MNRTLRIIVLSILFIFVGITFANAQELVLEDFHLDPADITARQAQHKDHNGDVCALLLINTGIPNIKVEGDLGGATAEYDLGVIRIWVPNGARSIKFLHPQFPRLEFDYPIDIKGLNTYKATLKGVYPAGESRLVLNVTPAEAKVLIDEKPVENNNGVVSVPMEQGTHKYFIYADEHKPAQGSVDIQGGVEILNITLPALYGFVEINTLPEDSMSIHIDGKYVGLSQWPNTEEERAHARFSPGRYSVRIEKVGFHPLDTSVVVPSGGKTERAWFTLREIEKPQEKVYKGYMNLSYEMNSLKPIDNIATGVSLNNGLAIDTKSKFGLSLQMGTVKPFHKEPIGGFLQFGYDIRYLDLSFRRYGNIASDGSPLYNSDNKTTYTDKHGDEHSANYVPWNVKKSDLFYSLSIGPTITFMPFRPSASSASLRDLQFNLYALIGYGAGVMWFSIDEDADAGTAAAKDKDDIVWMFSHGLRATFGLNAQWRKLGLGFEHQIGRQNYKPADAGYGNSTEKFSSPSSRIYLQLRF